jgi:hypothetical protein
MTVCVWVATCLVQLTKRRGNTMATYSKKMMGKEVGAASVYAPPHKMDGKALKISSNPGKDSELSSMSTMRMSVGNINNGESTVKTSGIKIRGTGAATKGTMSRGPMA